MKNLKLKKGFSLVELLVVITIIAILSVVAYTAVGGQTTKAKNSRRMQDLTTIQTALEIFFAEKGKYPDMLDGAVDGKTTDLTPKHMPKMALDPTSTKAKGVSYKYMTNDTNKKYILAATIEKEDDKYEAYVVGNDTGTIIMKGKEYNKGWKDCAKVVDKGSCAPYEIK